MPVRRLEPGEFGNRRTTSTVSAAGKVAARRQTAGGAVGRTQQNSPGAVTVAGVDAYNRTIVSQGTASTRIVDSTQEFGRVPGLEVEAHFATDDGDNRVGKGEIPSPSVSALTFVINDDVVAERVGPSAFEEPELAEEFDACDVGPPRGGGGGPTGGNNVIVIRPEDDPEDDEPQDIDDVDPNLDPCQSQDPDAQNNVWLNEGVQPTFPATLEGCYVNPETGTVRCLWIPEDPEESDPSISEPCENFGTSYNCVDGGCVAVDGMGGAFSDLGACNTACAEMEEPPVPGACNGVAYVLEGGSITYCNRFTGVVTTNNNVFSTPRYFYGPITPVVEDNNAGPIGQCVSIGNPRIEHMGASGNPPTNNVAANPTRINFGSRPSGTVVIDWTPPTITINPNYGDFVWDIEVDLIGTGATNIGDIIPNTYRTAASGFSPVTNSINGTRYGPIRIELEGPVTRTSGGQTVNGFTSLVMYSFGNGTSLPQGSEVREVIAIPGSNTLFSAYNGHQQETRQPDCPA